MANRKRDAGLLDLSLPSPKKQKFSAPASKVKSRPIRAPISRKPPQKKITGPKGKPQENRIVCGIDYGTTHSGIAFTRTANSESKDVRVIKEWPGTALDQFEKVPSRIALASENGFGEDDTEDKWGYMVLPKHKSYSWTKLLLDSNAAASRYDSATLSKQVQKGLLELPNGKSATEVVESYLRQLYKHAMARMCTMYGADVVKVNKIEFFFTVPATWSASAIDATEQAASKAGFGKSEGRENDTLSVITEPDAAAIASLALAIDGDPGLYKKGVNVLVADLGGGTVDFQCSKIESLNPLKMSDAVTIAGGKCGSISIDSEFCRWMEQVFSEDYTNLPADKIGIGSDFMNLFEAQKKGFDGKNLNKTVSISLPSLGHALKRSERHLDEYDFEEYSVILPRNDLKRMFDPVIKTKLALVKGQRTILEKEGQKPIRVIYLCGGLGNSTYVSNRFQRYVDRKLDGQCALVTDARAWSSVVRGAAIRGLEGAVVSSRLSKSYIGFGVHQQFREGVDNEEDSFVDDLNQERAGGCVNWVLDKSQRFTDNMECASKLFEPVDSNREDDRKRFSWTLYSCIEDVAPHRSDAVGVVKLAEIELDLSSAYPKPKSKVKIKIKGGAEAAEIRAIIKMGDEKGKLAVLARHKRKVVGTAVIDYTKIGVDSYAQDTQKEIQHENQDVGMENEMLDAMLFATMEAVDST